MLYAVKYRLYAVNYRLYAVNYRLYAVNSCKFRIRIGVRAKYLRRVDIYLARINGDVIDVILRDDLF